MASPDGALRTRATDPGASPTRGRPVLVTGVPRSGTTWLARELAAARLAALPGREPMNPRRGQFGLGGTLTSWTELSDPSQRQVRTLARCYRGHEVRTFSRYGRHQWRFLLPGARTVVKDPFALLSVPTIVAVTGAVPVIVYRHPGAVLASYRRMGWVADSAEIRRIDGGPQTPPPSDDARAMAEFWSFLHERVLSWVDDVPDALLVSHAEVSRAGDSAVRALMTACGLDPRPAGRAGGGSGRPRTGVPPSGQLHGFDRSPDDVVDGWRSQLDVAETSLVAAGTRQIWERLEARRYPLS